MECVGAIINASMTNMEIAKLSGLMSIIGWCNEKTSMLVWWQWGDCVAS
jgi:hypothetical protein